MPRHGRTPFLKNAYASGARFFSHNGPCSRSPSALSTVFSSFPSSRTMFLSYSVPLVFSLCPASRPPPLRVPSSRCCVAREVLDALYLFISLSLRASLPRATIFASSSPYKCYFTPRRSVPARDVRTEISRSEQKSFKMLFRMGIKITTCFIYRG